ncbi:thiamine phosphate synthase [Pajaroellobacter abortibovis]|nr:thiamine phosphate synthase [Pajaroellobacter abortibovis]
MSTYSDEEIEKGLALKPSYLVLGPLFPTFSKKANAAPRRVSKPA